METGKFTGFEVSLEKPGIAWIEFNEPEKLNGMNSRKKRDLIETLTQAQMDNAVRVIVFIGQGRVLENLKLYVEAARRRNARKGARFIPLDLAAACLARRGPRPSIRGSSHAPFRA